MKRLKKLFICLVVLFSFSPFINATCKNNELNEWAATAEVKFTEVTDLGLSGSEYAYLLSVTPPRNDIKLKSIDVNGVAAESKMLQAAFDQEEILAVGGYTNLEEETYTIEVYGAENSKCPNELLKTLKYTVPRFNRYIKDKSCVDSDSELCKTFTNATADMTEADFKEAMKKENNRTNPNGSSNILAIILDYGLYIIIPLAIISAFYLVRINQAKKEERDR